MRVVRTIQRDVMDFVAARMPPVFGDRITRGHYAGLGVLDEDYTLVAGVIFNQWDPEYSTIQVSVAADTPKWATRNVIREILGYAFSEININKVWCLMASTGLRAQRFNAGIGFTREAVLRHHLGQGTHAILTSMMAEEYRKFYLEKDGVKALLKHRHKVQQSLRLKEAA